MFTIVTDGIQDYLNSLTGAGLALQGINTIQTGQRDPLSMTGGDMPAITLGYSNIVVIIPQPGVIKFDAQIHLEMYTAGDTDISVAHDGLMNLILSRDMQSGLLAALARSQQIKFGPGKNDSLSFLLKGSLAIMYGQSKGAGYLYGCSCNLYTHGQLSF